MSCLLCTFSISLRYSYEEEQRTLTERAALLRAELDKEQEKVINIGQFIALVQKYATIDELTPALVNEFISRITVYAPDRSSGKRTQRIDIQYNFVGEIPVSLAKLKTA